MGAEHTAEHVRLVYHHVTQIPEQPVPGAVVGEDAHVQHVGVGDDDAGASPDCAPVLAWGVAVVDGVAGAAEPGRQGLQRLALVLRQRLGGEYVERTGGAVLDQGLDHRHLVAQALAAGGRRRDDDVLALPDLVDGLDLMGVQRVDALRGKSLGQAWVQGRVEFAVLSRARRDALAVYELVLVPGHVLQIGQKRVDVQAAPIRPRQAAPHPL